MNDVLAVNKAKKIASKAKKNFESAMEESAKKEESPPAENEESAQEEVRIYSLQIFFIFQVKFISSFVRTGLPPVRPLV